MKEIFTLTTSALKEAAAKSFRTSKAGDATKPPKSHVPPQVKKLISRISSLSKLICRANDQTDLHTLKTQRAQVSKQYSHAIRRSFLPNCRKRDATINSVLSTNPKNLYKTIRKLKVSQAPALDTLHIGESIFRGAQVANGFYLALSSLKNTTSTIAKQIFNNIINLCKHGVKIPPVSHDQAQDILKCLKWDVRDIFDNSPDHFLQAGEAGISHYAFLLNAVIWDIIMASLQELNSTCLTCATREAQNQETKPLLGDAFPPVLCSPKEWTFMS